VNLVVFGVENGVENAGFRCVIETKQSINKDHFFDDHDQRGAELTVSNDIHARFLFFHRAVSRNNALAAKNMTNTSSGSKRPHDGPVDTEHRKRSRDSQPRDWKDVRASGKSYGARDRHTGDDRYRRDYSPRRDRDRDHRGRDERRERDDRRDRARRDGDRYRDRRHEDRGRHFSQADERRHRTPESPRHPSNSSTRLRRTPDSDREEGE
jgi:hypothetical protein